MCASPPSRLALKQSAKRFNLVPEVRHESMGIKPVLPPLLDHLEDTANATEDILQTSMEPFFSL